MKISRPTNAISKEKFEIIAITATVAGKFLFYDILDQRLIFIIILFVFWGVHVAARVRTHPEILKHWGFRHDNFKLVLNKVLPFGLVAIATCIAIGLFNNTINVHWHIIAILIVYPFFGVLQQFLLMSFIAGNLDALPKMNRLSIIAITSILFGLLHYPEHWLMLGTFLLSLFYTHVFLSNKNLYVLGLFHGWLGTIFYYTVVGKDPYIEVFGLFSK